MRKTKLYLLIMLAAGVFLLSACGKKQNENTNDDAANVTSDFTENCIAESDKGYYFWEQPNEDSKIWKLLFMDKESQKVVPLCNKPDCRHEDEECNAYYPEIDVDHLQDAFDKHYLQYVEGNLYAIGCDADGYASLYRIQEDGSGWENVMQLFRTNYSATGHWISPEVWIANGCVYYADTMQKCMQLTRKSIEGKDEEVIFEDISKDNLEVYRLRGTSQYLYFEAMATSSENSEEYEGGLYRCDLSSGESTLMVKNLVGPYSIAGEQVYYTNESGLCCYSIQKQTTDIIVNQPMEIQKITLTENYMIVCDGDADNRLVIYDYDGNEMATVEGDSSLTNYYGGNNNLLFGLRVDEYSMSWCTLDLSNINNGLQWKSL